MWCGKGGGGVCGGGGGGGGTGGTCMYTYNHVQQNLV